MKLTPREMILFRQIFTKNFNMTSFLQCLEKNNFSDEEINRIVFEYVEKCIRNSEEIPETVQRDFGTVYKDCESGHMVEVIVELLKHGLDPNCIVYISEYGEEYNIMDALQSVDNGYVSADTLAVLLEHGGNPSIIIEGESLAGNLNDEIIFGLFNQEDRLRYDSLVHFWMVLTGYGAKLENGEEYVDVCKGFNVSQFKNHRNYYYGGIHSDRSNDGIEICFFDKETNMEVARY